MTKRARVLAAAFAMIALSACGSQVKISYPPVSTPKNADAYRPLSQIVDHQSVGVKGFPYAQSTGYDAKLGILVPSWDLASDQRGRRDGLYLIDAHTGKVTRLIEFPRGTQANESAIGGHWVVWEDGSSGNGPPIIGISGEDLRTHRRFVIYIPRERASVRDAIGMNIVRNYLYWLNTEAQAGSTVTAIERYNLNSGRLQTLLRYSTKTSPDIIFWIDVVGSKVYFSLHESRYWQDTTAPGSIDVLELSSGKVHALLPVWHAPVAVAANSGGWVSFVDNYQKSPNSSQNRAPFPLYLFGTGGTRVQQITVPGAQPEFPSMNKRFVAWWDYGQNSKLLDLKTGLVYEVPGQFAEVYGNVLTWNAGGAIFWARLP